MSMQQNATRPDGLPYREILAEHGPLWGDEYAMTMAQALHSNDKHDQVTTFHAYIRRNPFGGQYLITAGQNIVFEWLKNNWSFSDLDLAWLKQKKVQNPKTGVWENLYTDEFLEMLKNSKMELSVEAMLEGDVAFPDEPIFRVRGPLWQCLLVEAAILNIMNSQSLFATLAHRLTDVAEGAPILEFGLRRAQCLGGLEPSRGSYVGGVQATSNQLAGLYYGIPTSGTFAHALVMVYEDELQAFRDYARAMPNSTIFLVDTYNTVEGVKKAIQTCKELGIGLKGIRLDSGDLSTLSKQARELLDAAGFPNAKIAASNDLDERTIAYLKKDGAKIDVWGVGTNLATSSTQPALGGVYKVGAVYFNKDNIKETIADLQAGRIEQGNVLRQVIKLSEQTFKVTIPGELDVLRFVDEKGVMVGDVIYDYLMPIEQRQNIVESLAKKSGHLMQEFNPNVVATLPICPIFDQGRLIGKIETVHEARTRAQNTMQVLFPKTFQKDDGPAYPVGLEKSLWQKRQSMLQMRKRFTK